MKLKMLLGRVGLLVAEASEHGARLASDPGSTIAVNGNGEPFA